MIRSIRPERCCPAGRNIRGGAHGDGLARVCVVGSPEVVVELSVRVDVVLRFSWLPEPGLLRLLLLRVVVSVPVSVSSPVVAGLVEAVVGGPPADDVRDADGHVAAAGCVRLDGSERAGGIGERAGLDRPAGRRVGRAPTPSLLDSLKVVTGTSVSV